MNGFFNPKGFLLAGVLIVISGFLFNHFLGLQGELLLAEGETKSLVTDQRGTSDLPANKEGLGMKVTLDSLVVHPYTPEFEFRVMGPDTSSKSPGLSKGTGPLIGKFPAEHMKIQKVGDTDFYFRMKAFYPNFQFAYEYPANRDTIEPKAPGITLELKTKEGTPIVTLRTDQPNKHTIGDLVSLGASLFYFRQNGLDSIRTRKDALEKEGPFVVFSGAEQKVFFIQPDTMIEQPIKEGAFYKMPGQDTVGFTIMFSFPDYAYLKAVPSTKGDAVLNPVAQVEVWKEGEGYKEAFLYPERRGRKGGDYSIQETGHKLGLGEVKEEAVKHCDCFLSVQVDTGTASKPLMLMSGKSSMVKSFRFAPIECIEGGTGMVKIGIVKKPGRIQIIAGAAIIILTFSYMVFKRNRQVL